MIDHYMSNQKLLFLWIACPLLSFSPAIADDKIYLDRGLATLVEYFFD